MVVKKKQDSKNKNLIIKYHESFDNQKFRWSLITWLNSAIVEHTLDLIAPNKKRKIMVTSWLG